MNEFFSLYTGHFYKIEKKFYLLADDGQLPLINNSINKIIKCKKCYGRGHTGFSTIKYMYAPCNCVVKCIDKALISEKFNKI